MILHLINDEKIVDRTIESYEAVLNNKNVFIVFCNKGSGNFISKFVHSRSNVIFYDEKCDRIERDFSNFNKILIHLLDIRKINFVEKYIRHTPTIYWGIWGGDIYPTLLAGRGYQLFSPENSYLKRNKIKRNLLLLLNYYKIKSRKIEKFIHEKVDYIGGDDGDILLLKQYLGVSKKKFKSFAYPYDAILGEKLKQCRVDEQSKCILCGNSASYTNNQEYVLNFLKKMGVDSSYKVKMPLSYGGDKEYISLIIEKGKQYFGENYIPILDFLPLNQYNQLFIDARICIYGSWRQEAFGNIIIALYLGSKIYMSKNNPLTGSLKELGFSLFIIEEATQESFLEPLSELDKEKNRELIIDLYSLERRQQLIMQYFSDRD
jgi:dTDP-N-acetylfucosamine:lipid II N-acetylfucosaminyltransferase